MTEGGLAKFFINANEDKWWYNLKGKTEIMFGQKSDSIISSEEGRTIDHKVTCERIKLTGVKDTYDNRSWKQSMSDNLILVV